MTRYECTLLGGVRTDLQPWLTLDKPDITPVESSPGGHSMFVGFCSQFVFNIFQCTPSITSIIRKLDKDTAILLVRLKGKHLEPVCLDDRQAAF